MKHTKSLIFNHFYKLKHDLKRSYIFSNEAINDNNAPSVNAEWHSRIHPVYAMIFSIFSNPIELSDATGQLSDFFDISNKEARDLIKPFLNNVDPCHVEYAGTINNFPKNLIIDRSKAFCKPVQYCPEQFVYEELDFKQERYYKGPQGIVFMINNYCVTNCTYCYADKSIKKKSLQIDAIKSILVNAHNLGIVSFHITGGEFFLYKEWRMLLDELIAFNYKPPLISTKVPLKEQEILDFKPYNIPIQISLDSLANSSLMKILNVKADYLEKISKTIILLNQHSIRFQIATVLTTDNDSIENLESIYSFLKDFENIARWEIRVAFKSLYSKENFDTLKISRVSIIRIDKWIKNLRKTAKLDILWSPDGNSRYFKSEGGSKKFVGSKCSANSTHMVLLPDGKVTICEQLYWDPRFIIGDLLTQTIEEVWNSDRALELAFPKRENFRKGIVCKTCTIFDECFSYPNKCFADVLKAYGKENWDYPDPRCKKAPKFKNELFHI